MSLLLGLAIFQFAVTVFSVCTHDCVQAWMANRLGDPTARLAGRLTLSPVPHFDLFGTGIAPILYLFLRPPTVLAWGKPVPMTYRNFPSKNGELLATLAGPAAQLGTAILSLILLLILKHTIHSGPFILLIAEFMAQRIPMGATGLPAVFPVVLLLYLSVLVNLLLFVFNLLPLPLLDGGRVLVHFLPYNAVKAYEQYSLWIMIAFLFLDFYLIMLIFGPLFALFNGILNRL